MSTYAHSLINVTACVAIILGLVVLIDVFNKVAKRIEVHEEIPKSLTWSFRIWLVVIIASIAWLLR